LLYHIFGVLLLDSKRHVGPEVLYHWYTFTSLAFYWLRTM